MRLLWVSAVLAAAGLATAVGGLGWDAAMHAHDAGLAAREGVFTLANPSHLMFTGGLAMVGAGIAGVLIGLTRLRAPSPQGSPRSRRTRPAIVASVLAVAVVTGSGIAAYAATERSPAHNHPSPTPTGHTH